MNQFRLYVLLEMFPWLNEWNKEGRMKWLQSISIKKLDTEVLFSSPEQREYKSSNMKIDEGGKISCVLKETEELIKDIKMEECTFGSPLYPCYGKREGFEDVYFALHRLELEDKIAFIVEEEYGIHGDDYQPRNKPGKHWTLTIYKMPEYAHDIDDIVARPEDEAMKRIEAELDL